MTPSLANERGVVLLLAFGVVRYCLVKKLPGENGGLARPPRKLPVSTRSQKKT